MHNKFFRSLQNHLGLKKSSAFSNNSESGMTIIEILIVIALIGTIMTIVMTNVLKSAEEGKAQMTEAAQMNLKQALTMYKVNTNKFPTSDQGLKALVDNPGSVKGWKGPYTEEDKFADAFGVPMQYELISASKYKLTSAGIDGEFATPDDIIYPKEAGAESPVSAELTVPAGQNQAQ